MEGKAGPVFSSDELFRFVDLGLGRGIDATNPTPWLNKTSFQVRRVHKANIIGTDEGGEIQSYEREVASVHSQQTTMKLSITIPQSPLTLGTDAEQSRSISTSRRVIGKRVVNRTISFRDDFVDIPVAAKDFCSALEGTRSSIQLVKQFAEQEHDSESSCLAKVQSLLTFEERLATWLVQRIGAHREKARVLKKIDDKPSCDSVVENAETESLESLSPLEALAHIIERGQRSELKLIISACSEFVEHFRTTHYVSAIRLGAAEYRVLTEQEYYFKVGIAGSFGLDKVANGSGGGSFSSKKTRKASDSRTIGCIKDGVVERGSHGEAVVGLKILPISSLVRLQFLQLALEKALVRFVETQGDSSDGPFIISCDNNHLHLMVDPTTREVLATRDASQASRFFVAPTDDGHNRYEFHLVHYGDGCPLKKELYRRSSGFSHFDSFEVQPIASYLSASLNMFGKNDGPLVMKDSAEEEECRFVLHHRLSRQKSRATAFDLATWTSSRDIFYINCSRRSFKRDGYLVVKWDEKSDSFITACVSSIKDHSNSDTYMLFRLLPESVRNQEPAAHKRSTSVMIKNKELSKLSKLDDQEEEICRPQAQNREGMQNVRFCDDQLGAVGVHSVP